MRPEVTKTAADKKAGLDLTQAVSDPALRQKVAEEINKGTEEAKKKAKYKIQVWFQSERSTWKPMPYTISLWESGKRLHGGGDEMMFICRRQPDAPKLQRPFGVTVPTKVKVTDLGCNMPISGDAVQGDTVVCPHCLSRHRSSYIGDSIFYRNSAQHCAEVLYDWWQKLDCNADIYAKFSPKDPRTLMMSRNYDVQTARAMKGLTIYPLQNIIKDTALTGASVVDRFKVFITA